MKIITKFLFGFAIIAFCFFGSVLQGEENFNAFVQNNLVVPVEERKIFADDPLIFIGRERLEKLIKALENRKSIELLLGEGWQNRPGGPVHYLVLSPPMMSKIFGFACNVFLEFDDNDIVTTIDVTMNGIWRGSPKLNALIHNDGTLKFLSRRRDNDDD